MQFWLLLYGGRLRPNPNLVTSCCAMLHFCLFEHSAAKAWTGYEDGAAFTNEPREQAAKNSGVQSAATQIGMVEEYAAISLVVLYPPKHLLAFQPSDFSSTTGQKRGVQMFPGPYLAARANAEALTTTTVRLSSLRHARISSKSMRQGRLGRHETYHADGQGTVHVCMTN